MQRSPNKNVEYLKHPLNFSKSKSTFSFQKSTRFVLDKNYSPNKYYDKPTTLKGRASSMGFGKRTIFEKQDTVEPSKYTIRSDFEELPSHRPKGFSFSINRDEYYRGKSTNNLIGPGAYDVPEKIGTKNFYMGRKVTVPETKGNTNSFVYKISNESLNKLSTHKNQGISCRIKTQYYPKEQLQPFDNRVPGPGAFTAMPKMYFSKEREQYLLLALGKKWVCPSLVELVLGVSNSAFSQQYFF